MNARTIIPQEATETKDDEDVSRFVLGLVITLFTAFIGGDTMYIGLGIAMYLWGVKAFVKLSKEDSEMYFIFAFLSTLFGFLAWMLGQSLFP